MKKTKQNSIDNIIRLNERRSAALASKDLATFAKCSMSLHKIEHKDKVDVNAYCIRKSM